ncbi:hypothetical protein IGI04_035503 [Brassica rapa subsp. trilocularis]|uniref:Uncharacterized protein n=1 Tax=Brassica rapa subsp. trilocularis TaxID=1813537 RepID=A0ABQ7LBS3_BRACM|nr:hypothetical protein IGI04_035503 [Brassica rapa subsp. trilocularis]
MGVLFVEIHRFLPLNHCNPHSPRNNYGNLLLSARGLESRTFWDPRDVKKSVGLKGFDMILLDEKGWQNIKKSGTHGV